MRDYGDVNQIMELGSPTREPSLMIRDLGMGSSSGNQGVSTPGSSSMTSGTVTEICIFEYI